MKVLLISVFVFFMTYLTSKYVFYYCDKKEGDSINECMYCHHPTHIMDKIPIISFIYLKGKCRYCHRKLPKIYLFIELSTLLLNVILYYIFGLSNLFFIYSLFSCILFTFVFIDIKSLEVPLSGLIMMLFCTILSFLIDDKTSIDKLVGACIVSMPFSIINAIKKNSIGEADILLLAIVGLLFGASGVLPFACVSYLVAGVYVIIMLLFGKLKRSSRIAMMPFFFIGFLFQVVFNVSILLV